jgi:PAS domain-containing protein
MKNRPTNSLLDNYLSLSNEEALDIFLNNLDEIVIMIDCDFRIIHATEKTRKGVLKNYGIEITSETTILELAPINHRGYILEICKSVIEGNERDLITDILIDGKPASFQTYFRPARNSSGEIVGAIIKAKDVTSQKKAEDVLKETEERWRFALEGGNQGVWDWNVQTEISFFLMPTKNCMVMARMI